MPLLALPAVWTAAAAAVVAAAAFYAWYWYLVWTQWGPLSGETWRGHVPGRRPRFPLGSLDKWRDLLATNKEILEDCDDRGWVTQWVFHKRSIAVVRADHVQKVLASSVERGMTPKFLNYMAYIHLKKFMGQESVALSNGRVWQQDRMAIASSLRPMYFTHLFHFIDTHVDRLSQFWLPGGRQEALLEVAHPLFHVTLDVLCHTMLGEHIGALDALTEGRNEPIFDAFHLLADDMVRRLSSPNPLDWMYFLGPVRPWQRKCNAARRLVLERVRTVVQKRVIRGPPPRGEDSDFLDHLLATQKGDPLADTQRGTGRLVDNLVTMMWAGFDTTSATVSFALYELSHKPEVQDELRRELADVSQGDALDFESMSAMRLLDAVIWEALRLHSPATWTGRTMLHDVTLDGGCVLKKGELGAIPIWAIHRSPLNWDRPDEFDPHRFLAPGCDVQSQRHRGALVPFGGGRRICPGNQLAPMEAKAILALLVQRFAFAPAPDRGVFGARGEPDMDAHGMFRICVNNWLRVSPARRDEGGLRAAAQQA